MTSPKYRCIYTLTRKLYLYEKATDWTRLLCPVNTFRVCPSWKKKIGTMQPRQPNLNIDSYFYEIYICISLLENEMNKICKMVRINLYGHCNKKNLGTFLPSHLKNKKQSKFSWLWAYLSIPQDGSAIPWSWTQLVWIFRWKSQTFYTFCMAYNKKKYLPFYCTILTPTWSA